MLLCFVLSILTSLSFILSTIARAINSSVPEPPSRISNSGCQFYGYVEPNVNVWNVYTIQLAGWGNNGTLTGCASELLSQVQSQCRTDVLDWTCDEVEENLHDTEVSFKIAKEVISQPGCAAGAIRSASEEENKSDDVDCICLAYCYPSEVQYSRDSNG
ncbi:hypothetical protein F5X96DRAFT_681777 [Biscogniauxia mediterranea]|nr:hypothetical protein F5X96DRAFT_681777 [Biscogniauxia mediterranea]